MVPPSRVYHLPIVSTRASTIMTIFGVIVFGDVTENEKENFIPNELAPLTPMELGYSGRQ